MVRERPAILLGEVTPNNLGQLKKLHSVIFPVVYNEKFYKGVLETPDYSRIVCSKRELQADGKTVHVYIMTLGVLSPYRRLGVGSALLAYVTELCEKDPNVKLLYLHMQVNNEEGHKFYESKGFSTTSTAEKYYKQIEPADAHVLAKAFHSSA